MANNNGNQFRDDEIVVLTENREAIGEGTFARIGVKSEGGGHLSWDDLRRDKPSDAIG